MVATNASPTIDSTTILSLLYTVVLLAAASYASLRLLPKTASNRTRILFIWHAWDALIHGLVEAGYLYNCFFSYTTIPTALKAAVDPSTPLPGTVGSASAYLPPNVHFLAHKDRLYGSHYATNPLSALWREYAKADARWGGSDLTVISLELLTVFIGAPLAAWICYCLTKQRRDSWFWMIVLATGELYGGFMTFAPEWLSGSPNLETGNWMYLWLYLTFFNGLWVALPFWILYEAYGDIVKTTGGVVGEGKKRR